MVVFRVDILWFLERGRFMVEPFSEWVVVVVWLWHVF